MIRLDIQDYCENCLDFEPEVETAQLLYYGIGPQAQTVIRCKYRLRCENIKRHLEGHVPKGGKHES